MDISNLKSKIIKKLTFDNIIKYVIEGIVVGLAVYYIPQRKMVQNEILIIAVMASISFFILDLYYSKV
jgi:hypothetical protein